MPSRDGPIRRTPPSAESPAPASTLPPHEVLAASRSALERYAGWLGKDHVSVAVRAAVKALGTAMDGGTETSELLLALARNIGRLPGGEMRKMVRKALVGVRAVLEPGTMPMREGKQQ